MTGKSFPRLTVAFVFATIVSTSALAALPPRPADAILHLLPAKVREWLDARERQPLQTPRSGRSAPKCGGGIDPNGQPCH
jgi:hypothetical protein